jgi:hypothetical protein
MRFNHGGVIGEIDNLPGCSQVAVFHSVFVPPKERGVGNGRIAHAERLVEAEHLGYDLCICTAQLSNTAQIRILESYNWTKIKEFTSTKTGNLVGVFIKDL